MSRHLKPLAIGLRLTAALILPAAVHAADLHVALTGDDDTGTGSAAQPWRTATRAVNAAQPGDVVLLHSGVYCEEVRIRTPDVTLSSAPGEWAMIRGEIGTNDRPGFAVMIDVDADGAVLRRLEVVGGYYGVYLRSKWDFGGPDRTGATDVLIEDCRIHDSGRDCIKLTPRCDRLTIRRCEVYSSGRLYPAGTPQENKNAEGIDNVNSHNMLVQDCYVHDTATTGVYFKGGPADCVVERTRVERCGAAGILVGFDTSPEFFDTTTNPNFYEAIRGTVRNCIVRDTNYSGIGFFAADGAVAVNNTVVNTAKLGHSPIYFGVTIQDYDPAAGRPASRNVQVRNNIVVQPATNAQPLVGIRFLFEPELGNLAGLSGMPAMSNNLYFANGAAARFQDRRPGSTLESGDLTAWQALIGSDAGSRVADPRLTADLHLSADSPAIDAGATVAAVTDDFDAAPRPAGAGLDIGADEFSTSPPPAPIFGTASDLSASACGDLLPNQPDPPVGGGEPGNGTNDPSPGPDDSPLDEALAPSGLCPMSAAALLMASFCGLCSIRRDRTNCRRGE